MRQLERHRARILRTFARAFNFPTDINEIALNAYRAARQLELETLLATLRIGGPIFCKNRFGIVGPLARRIPRNL